MPPTLLASALTMALCCILILKRISVRQYRRLKQYRGLNEHSLYSRAWPRALRVTTTTIIGEPGCSFPQGGSRYKWRANISPLTPRSGQIYYLSSLWTHLLCLFANNLCEGMSLSAGENLTLHPKGILQTQTNFQWKV